MQLPDPEMKFFNSKGYTMIELLVVILIMTILGTLAISNYGTLARDQALTKAVLNVQSFVRTAQSNATDRVACPDSVNGGQSGGASWIVTFPSASSMQFTCQLGAASPSIPLTPYQLSLQDSVAIQTVYDASNNSLNNPCAATSVKLTFAPLYGNVTFSDSGSCGWTNPSNIKIVLLNSNNGKTKNLLIDKGGAVYEQ